MSTVFYYGVIMKRYFCFFLAVLITAMSIILYRPFNIYANDAFTISKNSTEKTGLTADEAQKAIDANADIKGKDGVTMLLYTPSDSYNYTLKSGAFVAHLSDSQAKAMLMSKKSFQQYVVLCSSLISNSTVFRGFLKTVGIATTGDSDALTNIVDKFTCNYNYLDSINYDEDTQTITMSNDNSSVDKLRKEIRNQYYKDNGMFYIGGNLNKPTDIIKSSWYDDMTLYQEDYNAVSNYDFAIGSDQNAFYINSSDYSYVYLYLGSDRYFGTGYQYSDASVWLQFVDNDLNPVTLPNYTKSLNCTEHTNTSNYNMPYDNFAFRFHRYISSNVRGNYSEILLNEIKNMVCLEYTYDYYERNLYVHWKTDNLTDYSDYDYVSSSYFYSKPNKSFVGFTSYEALFNYVHGESSAYLGSAINKAGEDITFSIKDMNENLGNKMDSLIDSINSGKGNMSADELQNAIDKGLEDLNKNTEDIKDNTSDILDTLKEQNNILLQILGVTEYIAYQNDKYNNTYTKADMSNLFKKSFNRVSDAVLYGEKVDDDNEETVDRSKFSYHNGIFGHFPFSVPYQLYEWLKVFQAEPECPEFTYHYGFLIGISKDSDEYDKYKITFNLSAYDSWREVAASFLKLAFTLTMAIGTYKKFKGEL